MSYQAIELKIHALIAEKKLDEVLAITEDFELDACNQDIKPFYTVQLLAYLISDDLDSGRFLWKRIPTEIKKSDIELQSVWGIGQRLWVQDYAGAYAAFKSFNWTPLHATLVEILEESFRERSFAVTAKAYSVVSVKSLALLLGQSVDDVSKYAVSKGWEVVADGFLKTKPVSQPKFETATLANMQSLTDYVVYLES